MGGCSRASGARRRMTLRARARGRGTLSGCLVRRRTSSGGAATMRALPWPLPTCTPSTSRTPTTSNGIPSRPRTRAPLPALATPVPWYARTPPLFSPHPCAPLTCAPFTCAPFTCAPLTPAPHPTFAYTARLKAIPAAQWRGLAFKHHPIPVECCKQTLAY